LLLEAKVIPLVLELVLVLVLVRAQTQAQVLVLALLRLFLPAQVLALVQELELIQALELLQAQAQKALVLDRWSVCPTWSLGLQCSHNTARRSPAKKT
jgi:hypothetical protein